MPCKDNIQRLCLSIVLANNIGSIPGRAGHRAAHSRRLALRMWDGGFVWVAGGYIYSNTVVSTVFSIIPVLSL